MTTEICAGRVYRSGRSRWLVERVDSHGHVYLKAVQPQYGKWGVIHGHGSRASLSYEHGFQPVRCQWLARLELVLRWAWLSFSRARR